MVLLSLLLVWQSSHANSPKESKSLDTTAPTKQNEKKFSSPDRIRYDGSCLTIDGKDIVILSAAFHYFRCPKELWKDRFKKIKEAGFNTVETYVPWNWHELNMPKDVNDFSKCDFSDLKAWLKMAQDEFGLYTIVRPGPFICAEWAGGAYPRWLAKYCPEKYNASFWLRSDDTEHIKWSQHWYNTVCPILAQEQLTHKPKGAKGIIMVQLENEYIYFDMSSEGKINFLKALYNSAKANGINVPLFTCVTPEVRGSKDEKISQLFDMDNLYVWWNMEEVKSRMEELKTEQPDAPAYVCELQGGWFSKVGGNLSEDSKLDGRHARGMALMALAGGATGINYYMLFGGTHFAGWGARGMTTSYDYGAAIKENGGVGEKYLAVKGVCEFVNLYGNQLARAQAASFKADSSLKDLTIGLRQSIDGTRFIFILNKHKKERINKSVTLSLYDGTSLSFDCKLDALDSKILVLPAGVTDTSKGEWFPRAQADIARPTNIPAPIRISTAYRQNESLKAKWIPLDENVSLPEIDVNDCRYSLYKSNVKLSAADIKKYGTVVFDMFSADPMFVQVNGKLASRVSSDEYNNVFNVVGLLKQGNNKIIALYENQGHQHGYKPMEELSGMRKGGLGRKQSNIVPIESWEVIKATSDSDKDIATAMAQADGWEKIMLDNETISGLSTLQIAGLEKPKWPAAWILQGVSGTAIYKTQLSFTPEMITNGKTVLEFGCVDDQGILFVNGTEVARHDAWDMPFIVDVGKFVKPGINTIAIAVSNSSGSGGLLKPVRLRETLAIQRLLKWNVAKDLAGVSSGLTTDSANKEWKKVMLDTTMAIPRKGNNIQPKGLNDALLTWYKVEFELPETVKNAWIPWRMVVNASGNGYMWLNGHNIGRHWEIGPQREFFLPECWLKTGKGNKNIIVFGLRQTPESGALLKAIEIAPYPNECEAR